MRMIGLAVLGIGILLVGNSWAGNTTSAPALDPSPLLRCPKGATQVDFPLGPDSENASCFKGDPSSGKFLRSFTSTPGSDGRLSIGEPADSPHLGRSYAAFYKSAPRSLKERMIRPDSKGAVVTYDFDPGSKSHKPKRIVAHVEDKKAPVSHRAFDESVTLFKPDHTLALSAKIHSTPGATPGTSCSSTEVGENLKIDHCSGRALSKDPTPVLETTTCTDPDSGASLKLVTSRGKIKGSTEAVLYANGREAYRQTYLKGGDLSRALDRQKPEYAIATAASRYWSAAAACRSLYPEDLYATGADPALKGYSEIQSGLAAIPRSPDDATRLNKHPQGPEIVSPADQGSTTSTPGRK